LIEGEFDIILLNMLLYYVKIMTFQRMDFWIWWVSVKTPVGQMTIMTTIKHKAGFQYGIGLGLRCPILQNVTLYSAKLRNPTQVATMTTALDLGVFLEKWGKRATQGRIL
jgi:hypothetical protein